MINNKQSFAGQLVTEEIESIRSWLDGYKMYQIIHAAINMQLFERLRDHGGLSKEDITSSFGIAGQFVRFFLQALMDVRLLELRETLYVPTALSAKLLVSDSPTQVIDLFNQVSDPQGKWSRIASQLAGSENAETMAHYEADYQQSLPEHMEITKQIVQWEGFTQSRALLEISSPSSLHAIGVCRNSPILIGTVLCGVEQRESAEAAVSHFNLNQRIRVQTGVMPNDLSALGREAFDIVIVSHALYGHRKSLVPFLQSLAEVIRSGGLLVLNHYYCSANCGDAFSGLRDIDQAITIAQHPLCDPVRFKSFIEMAGFTVTANHEVQGISGHSQLFIAVKESVILQEPLKGEGCCRK